MRQLGNLAIAVAQHKNAKMEIRDGKVIVIAALASGKDVAATCLKWDEDKAIEKLVYQLNHGRYAVK